MIAENQAIDVNASILKHINMIKPWFPKRALISIGEYSSEILKEFQISENGDIVTLVVGKTKNENQTSTGTNSILEIDTKSNSHYWFNVQEYLANDTSVPQALRQRFSDKLSSAIFVASTAEGSGSFMMPTVASQLREGEINSVGFAILPSEFQAPDAFFNSLWSMATCTSQNIVQVVVDRDGLEEYVGVNRKGSVLKGEGIFNYILDLVLKKESFVQELCDLSSSFNVNTFTILAATGASFKVHGSLDNILNAALFKPLSSFDFSSASVLYVLVRVPHQLKNRFSRRTIELTVSKWFKERAILKAVYVSEPVYVIDGSDRIDVAMFVGGFSLAKRVKVFSEKVKDIVGYAVKNGFISEEKWDELVRNLVL